MSAAVDLLAWGDFYPDSCRVETFTTTRDEDNDAGEDWTPATDGDGQPLTAIKCAVRFAKGQETFTASKRNDAGALVASVSHVVKLQGHYDSIKSDMRLLVTDSESGAVTTYQIEAVAHTSGKSRTKVFVCSTT